MELNDKIKFAIAKQKKSRCEALKRRTEIIGSIHYILNELENLEHNIVLINNRFNEFNRRLLKYEKRKKKF